jgi:hypothetical protein
MWTTLALLSALSAAPAQEGKLEIKNARFTHGILGQERKDAAYLLGDMVILSFDIEGLKVSPEGQVKYRMGMTVTKGSEKVYGQEPQDMIAVNTLGGSRQPALSRWELLYDIVKPGEYTMTVDVKDNANGATAKLERKIEVKAAQFGIVRPGLTYIRLDEEDSGLPKYAPPIAVPGQALMLFFGVTGFEMKGDKQQANVEVRMDIQDESGKSVRDKPFVGKATDIDEMFKKLHMIPFNLPIVVNRSGKFKIVLTAEDKHTGKKDTLTLDLQVVEVK